MNCKIKQVEEFLGTGQPLTVLDCFNLYIESQWQTNYQTGSRYKKYYLIN